MKFLKHLFRLLKDFFSFAWKKKAFWILPVIIILLLITIVIVTSSTLAPFIYPLF